MILALRPWLLRHLSHHLGHPGGSQLARLDCFHHLFGRKIGRIAGFFGNAPILSSPRARNPSGVIS
jgi:hypothetical protein